MRVLIVDDHPLVRMGISTALSFEENIEEVIEASNVGEALRKLSQQRIEIALIDLNLGKEQGLDIILKARRRGFLTKFIILTSSLRREDFERAREIGVDGYILKEAFPEDILYALSVVSRGKNYIDPEFLSYKMKGTMQSGLDELTQRERDVLMELGKGLSNSQIAQRLHISENTVKKHVSNILSKLELHHRTEAALFVSHSLEYSY